MNYCTVADVLAIATEFQSRFTESGGMDPIEITSLIAKASNRVDMALYTRYEIATIQGYSPTFPPSLVDLTAVIAAQMLLRRYASSSFEHNNAMAMQLEDDRILYTGYITNGTLLDSSGLLVPSIAGMGPTLLQPAENEILGELYANGNRSY